MILKRQEIILKVYKYISAFMIMIIFIITSAVPFYATEDKPQVEPPELNRAMYAYLYSVDNNQVLYAKNTNDKIYPASFTKLMASIIALEHYGTNTSKKIAVTSEMLNDVSGNNIALKVDEVVTAENMLNAMIVGGSNDAAQVIAIDVAGSINGFVKLMNEKAQQIGTMQTVFTNPTGIHDDDMYTTMEDIAKIALYAYKLNRYTEISSQMVYDMPETNVSKSRRIVNRNNLVSTYLTWQYYNPEAIGLNAGSTPKAGYCLATVVNHNGLTYLCIISGASSDDLYIYSYVEASKLLNWVYENWGYVTVLKTTTSITQLPVRLASKTDTIALHPSYEVELYLPSGVDIEKDVERVITVYEDILTAPVDSGLECGILALYYQGQLISEVPLITKNYIDKSYWMYFVDFTDNTIHSRWFKTSVLVFIVLFTSYTLINAHVRYRRSKTKVRNKIK